MSTGHLECSRFKGTYKTTKKTAIYY